MILPSVKHSLSDTMDDVRILYTTYEEHLEAFQYAAITSKPTTWFDLIAQEAVSFSQSIISTQYRFRSISSIYQRYMAFYFNF